MKKLKRAVSLLLAAVLAASAAGCSGDKSWSVKDSSTTVSIGSYIYNLYTAYESARSKVSDSSKKVLEQKIDNQDAASWIRSQALTQTKELILLDRKMKNMKLSLTDDEKTQAKTGGSSIWSSYSKQLEGYGIAQSSFQTIVDSEYKKEKIFEVTYGKGGTKEVKDEELKGYFDKNYTSFSYLAYPLYTTDSSGNSKDFTDDQKKKAKELFDGFAGQVKAGKQTMQQANDEFKKTTKDSELQSDMINLSSSTQYPNEITKALKSMKTGETKVVEITSSKVYILLYKTDTAKNIDEKVKNETSRKSLLSTYKWQGFSDALEKEANSLSDVTLNESAINSYNPSMFQS